MIGVALACGGFGVGAGWLLGPLIERVPAREPVWRRPLGPASPALVAATVVLFVSVALRFGASWVVPAYLVFFASLLAVAVIDLGHLIVPNRIIYPTLGLTVVLLGGAAALEGNGRALEHALVGGLVSFGAFVALHFISPKGMGFGDVRLAGVIGAYLGWLGYDVLGLGLFLGFLLASVVGLVLIVIRVRGRRDAVPFAPFLAAGAVIAVLWGTPLLRFYHTGHF